MPGTRQRGAVDGRVRKSADVDWQFPLGSRFERQVVEAPMPAFVARPSLSESVTDHLDPFLEQRWPVLALEAKHLELVLHIALADPQHEPPA
jgi:hypothetical protein